MWGKLRHPNAFPSEKLMARATKWAFCFKETFRKHSYNHFLLPHAQREFSDAISNPQANSAVHTVFHQ